MKNKSNKSLSLEELQVERDRVQKMARQHALQTALAYYQMDALPKGEKDLKNIVFANWLDEHAFTERFKPMKWISV